MDFEKNNEEIVEVETEEFEDTELVEFDEEDLDSMEETPPQVEVNSGNNGNNGLSLEEQVREMSDKLISTVLGENDECKSLRKLLFNAFKPDIFRDENYVIYKVLYSFKDRDFLPDAEFMRMYLLRNEWVLREAGSKINLNAYSEVDENPAIGYIMGVIKQYNRLSKEKNLDLNEFKLIIEKYKMGFQSLAIEEVLDHSKIILTEGLTENRKHLQGYEDSKLLR
ncbi:MAG: hypothetical protein LBM93_05655 [Oscillospiraceae bacterium]|nr:hypothetical protein [Oscillospiraceae bacterium]